ncbi:MAG TPA: glycosyltransferase family 4 protein [Flavisolibacter sp.]|nr:glycosyltransferase family 4 protein [Flavisolibacter sp.]
MKFRLYLLKRIVEDIFMFPLIMVGRAISFFSPLEKDYAIFFFFPFYHTGGAEKVHALTATAIGNKNCIIFFTKKSHNDGMLLKFEKSNCVVKDISRYTDNKWLYFVNIIFRGIISGYINRQKASPVVFNGQCNFGYKLSPWIRNAVPQIELIHSISNFSYIRIPFLPFINRTIMISQVRINDHLNLYKDQGIPSSYGKKIQFIMNAIDLPLQKPMPKHQNQVLNVLYVGRSTPEKRVYLIARIASLIREAEANIQFQFLGEVREAIPAEYRHACEFLGNHENEETINKIYATAHVLVLLSDTEGFPMVIMEAMANGLAVVATGVGEIPLHIKNSVSGFLIENYLDEKHVEEKTVEAILRLYGDRKLLGEISEHNAWYAYKNFGKDRFEKEYRELITDMKRGAQR